MENSVEFTSCLHLLNWYRQRREQNKLSTSGKNKCIFKNIFRYFLPYLFCVMLCVFFLCSFSKNCDLKQNYFAHKITVYLHVHGYFVISCVKNIKWHIKWVSYPFVLARWWLIAECSEYGGRCAWSTTGTHIVDRWWREVSIRFLDARPLLSGTANALV